MSIEGYSATSYELEINCLSRSGNQVIALCFSHDSLLGSYCSTNMNKTKTKLRGLSPHANYTDRAAASGRRS